MKESTPKRCVTCGEPLKDEYCYKCGEKVHHRHEFALLHYTHEIIHQVIHLDAKIFKTLQILTTCPGQLTEEYLVGRKSKYVRPIRLYLFWLLVQVS